MNYVPKSIAKTHYLLELLSQWTLLVGPAFLLSTHFQNVLVTINGIGQNVAGKHTQSEAGFQ